MIAYVYFALDTNTQHIKIGCCKGTIMGTCPITRIRSLGKKVQFLGCVPVLDDVLKAERGFHDRFRKSHVKGEWFRLSEELKVFIQTRTQGHVCERCAGDTIERRRADDQSASAAAQAVFGSK